MGHEVAMREEARAVWLRPSVESLIGDVAYAARGLRRNPAFTICIVLTLGLGIGANASMFSLVDRLLFRAPPLMIDGGAVSRLYVMRTSRGSERTRALPYALYADIARGAKGYQVAAFSNQNMAVDIGGTPRPMSIGVVSAGFFGFFAAPPQLGRYFTDAEDAPPLGAQVVVLSSGTWKSEFGGSRDVLGRTIRIGDLAYSIIGVAPDEFAGVWPYRAPQAFIPVATFGAREGGTGWATNYGHAFGLSMMVRRPPHMTQEAASANLTDVYRQRYQQLYEANPQGPTIKEAQPRIVAAPVLLERGPSQSNTGRIATWVSGVTLVVLFIACANVANLLLVRMLRRRREVAVRTALGAGRARLFRQLFIEGALVALIGGAAGVLLATGGSKIVHDTFLPGTGHVPLLTDPRTLLFALALIVAIGCLTGGVQILQLGKVNVGADLKAGAREGTHQRSRLRAGLLTVQCALSVLLLIGAGLFLRSLGNVRDVRLGFDPAPVLLVSLDERGLQLDSAASVALRRRMLERAEAMPGVSHATLQQSVPFAGISQYPIAVAGIDSASAIGDFQFNAVSPGYFATMNTRILRGRGIESRDVDGAERVVVVGESMGKALWPGRDPIGQCVRVGIPAETAPCRTVVGIAEDIHAHVFDEQPKFFFYYLAAAQWQPQASEGLFVRAQGDPAALVEPLRRVLQSELPPTSLIAVRPYADVIGGQMRTWSLGASLFTAFGALALVLAAVGLYSGIAYSVAQRRHEMGVRLALGADRGRVVRLVLRDGLRYAIPGIAIGCAIALGSAKWIQPLLFQLSPRDPAVVTIVCATLLVVATMASWIPAMRAGRLDPKEALNSD
jgi:putative ABC transport system permease protein